MGSFDIRRQYVYTMHMLINSRYVEESNHCAPCSGADPDGDTRP